VALFGGFDFLHIWLSISDYMALCIGFNGSKPPEYSVTLMNNLTIKGSLISKIEKL